jgi:HPt (histidine-containing phosphotransfer) domain-containing protein
MLDWDRIGSLRDEIGTEDFAEVVTLFFEEAESAVARLREPGSTASRESDLHFLKGCALNLGFSRLGDLCERAERRAASDAVDDAQILAVIVCYEASRAAFDEAATLPA